MNLTREQKHSIADQLTAGAAPESIDGYDAAATAEWKKIESDRRDGLDCELVIVGRTMFAPNVFSGDWQAVGSIAPVAPTKRKLTPGEEALRIGRSYGVNGQIWDNA